MAITTTAINGTAYALIPLTTLVLIARFARVIRHPKEFKWEDLLLLLAYAFFIELTAVYLTIVPVYFRVAAVGNGKLAPYPTVVQDSIRFRTYYFVTTLSLWLCLWMVKFSLLSLYKRFLSGKVLIIAWWATMTFCVLALIGCALSSWLSCTGVNGWFTADGCAGDRNAHMAKFSLYFSYGVDVFTDLMIMILPLRLIWNLQMTSHQKRSIGALFCISWICVLFATIRVVEVGNNYEGGMPNPAWLALWGIIESSIAVIIGCCPGLYRFMKAHASKSGPSYQYDSHGFQWNSGTGMPTSRSHVTHGDGDITLSQMPAKSKSRHLSGLHMVGDRLRHDAGSSQEELARHSDDNIIVTQRVSISVKDRDTAL
ncbi:hypothetical protein BJX63DRAFT_438507 [Aspergillus granulosus]|uniref:Rhodopsin domain-containing protein n=1 Tax=Aspergillus granulosus TaxID=176169 RepID=A0ABR4GT84_9EURO